MTLEEEKLKVSYEHRLQLWRIVIEKVLLGILLGLVVLAADMLMEQFRSNLSRERFLLESRLTALQALRQSYSSLSTHMWYVAHEKKELSEKRLLAHGKNLDDFMHVANKWSLLFSERFTKGIDQHIWLHQAVAQRYSILTPDHWSFVSDVFDDFDHITRAALWEETLGVRPPPEGRRFEMEAWSSNDMNTKGPKAFFERNFEKWKQQNKKTP